jgi:hypothetical protein
MKIVQDCCEQWFKMTEKDTIVVNFKSQSQNFIGELRKCETNLIHDI